MIIKSLSYDCEWILRGDFNMTEQHEDESKDGGRGINDLEKLT